MMASEHSTKGDSRNVTAYHGSWWCVFCSREVLVTLQTNLGAPCCPKCGSPLEEQGTGDDDPYPEED